jgi:glycosyltransferase involved in cell wall biosynthesis
MKEGIIAKGVSAQNVSMIPNSSDLDRFAQIGPVSESAKAKFGVGGKFVLSYCGTIGEANGLDYILDAAAELLQQKHDTIAFLIVGEGREKPRLEQRVLDEQLSNVVFSPSIPKSEIHKVFEASDACMTIFKDLPVLQTCSPNKLFDTFAAGRPAITNMAGWLKNLVEAGPCGAYVDPKDPKDLAQKAIWLADHPGACVNYGEKARALAESDFSRDILAEQLERILAQKKSTSAKR